ncbi:WbqC family protein [Sedimentitalea todarodis]|uniref:WbqC family protein n=1 Tax=Sedimentitalea todarodis TaxID=1631240 RepID=A0ABU3V9F7_9RHOB|nr:WbqC family protein [Sedimentitalea todarodis]MDU9002728.1 WbqC family protein [Sedimentitalea todarodis]
MQTAIMQPYFLPYLGYFQLMQAAESFVVYDTIQYTKKGWINRNRLLRNGEPVTFAIPLKKDSDYLDVVDRRISESFDRRKLCAQIEGAYRKAPFFAETMPVVTEIIECPADNLFEYIHNSLRLACAHLGILTPIHASSEVEGGPTELRNADRVIDICTRLEATGYFNPPGGRGLYQAEAFRARGLDLRFLEPHLSPYPQFGAEFVPALSVLDVLMFNGRDHTSDVLLKEFELVE